MLAKFAWFRLAGALSLALLAAAAAGCGGGGGKENVVQVRGDEYAFVMPDRIEGGVVTMEVSNTGEELHEYALGRLAPGKTFEDLRPLLENPDEGPPPWLTDVGGVPLLSPGKEVSITRELDPAIYVLLCFIPAPDGKPHIAHGMVKSFEVAGDSGAELPEADATITAKQRGHDVPEIEAGRRTIELRNGATEGRDFLFAVFAAGKEMADVDRWFEGGMKGPAPVTFLGGMQTIPAGSSVYMTTELEEGTTYSVVETDTGTRAEFTPK
jgi:hypothetical protein